MSLPAASWVPLLQDREAAPVIVEMAAWLWTRGYLSGRAAMGDIEALAELAALDPLAAQLLQSRLPENR